MLVLSPLSPSTLPHWIACRWKATGRSKECKLMCGPIIRGGATPIRPDGTFLTNYKLRSVISAQLTNQKTKTNQTMKTNQKTKTKTNVKTTTMTTPIRSDGTLITKIIMCHHLDICGQWTWPTNRWRQRQTQRQWKRQPQINHSPIITLVPSFKQSYHETWVSSPV